jgi:hypothetical protein
MAADGMSGGDRLMAHLDRILARVKSAQAVRIGFLEGATYPDGTPVPMVAAVQEFGGSMNIPEHTVTVPARPFFRTMLDTKAPDWGKQIGKVLKASDYDAGTTLGRMGELIKGELQGSIRDLTSPPLAASTLREKGFSKPLIDTGVMLNSVDYEVKA